MPNSKTIAILGACSRKGATVADKLAGSSRLLLVDEDRECLLQLKNEILELHKGHDVEIMECFQDTGWEADAIVLASPSEKDREIFSLMKPYVTGKTVIVFGGDKEDGLKTLLPYSNVVRINGADSECVNKMQTILSETL